jgi:protease-4
MSLQVDFFIDRRRLKRQLTAWRVIGVVAIVAAVVTGIGRIASVAGRDQILRLDVVGVILDDPRRDKALLDVAADDTVKALIVRIDSPGGTVVGGETLYKRLRQVAQSKPVVAVMGELATSAAYMTAVGADHIVAREGTLTGSIGVILQTTDVTGLLEKLGIKPETVKSSPLKAQPNPFEPFTKEAREATREVVLDMYEMFVRLVAERRGLSAETVRRLADGRVFTGRQAHSNGLIDAFGGETEALNWLADVRGIDPEIPVRDIDLATPEEKLRDLIDGLIRKALFSERLKLDGLVSLWHPGW